MRVIGTFPDGKSTLMLVTARPRYIVEQEEVPGHVQTGGDGRVEGKSVGPEEDGEINLRKNLDGTRGPLFVKRALGRHPYTNIFDVIIPRSISCLNFNRICN